MQRSRWAFFSSLLAPSPARAAVVWCGPLRGMSFWAIQVLNGISFAMLLFLLAAGLSLIFGLMRILNLAHGSYYALGAYVALSAIGVTGSFAAAAAAGIATVVALGVVMERGLLRRLPR